MSNHLPGAVATAPDRGATRAAAPARSGSVPQPRPETVAGCCSPLASEPLDVAQSAEVAKAFKALGDPVRVRLLSRIASAPGETCVCDLTGGFDVSGPTISHHLKVLREAGLVDCVRRGTWVYYWAVRERLAWLSALLTAPGLDTAPLARGTGSGHDNVSPGPETPPGADTAAPGARPTRPAAALGGR